MTLSWKAVEADTHDAKVEAIEHAQRALADVFEMLDATSRMALQPSLAMLEIERGRHAERAALLRGAL